MIELSKYNVIATILKRTADNSNCRFCLFVFCEAPVVVATCWGAFVLSWHTSLEQKWVKTVCTGRTNCYSAPVAPTAFLFRTSPVTPKRRPCRLQTADRRPCRPCRSCRPCRLWRPSTFFLHILVFAFTFDSHIFWFCSIIYRSVCYPQAAQTRWYVTVHVLRILRGKLALVLNMLK